MLIKLDCSGHVLDIELAYATPNNFTGKPVYQRHLKEAFLHADALKYFFSAVKQADNLGLHFKVWDAFRPLEAQQALWNHTPNEMYISHPQTGVRPHCRGVALDLTLVDSQGHELDMGTVFDDFSSQAHQQCFTVNAKAQKNRMLLAGIMHTAGFVCNPFEWWHFQLRELESYPILTDKDAPLSMMS